MGGDRPGPLVWHIIDWNEELFVGFSTLGRQASSGWRSLPQFAAFFVLVTALAGSWLLAYTFLVLGGALTSLQTPQHSVLLLGCARSASGGQVLPRNPSLGGLDLRYVFNDLVVVFGSVLVACAVS